MEVESVGTPLYGGNSQSCLRRCRRCASLNWRRIEPQTKAAGLVFTVGLGYLAAGITQTISAYSDSTGKSSKMLGISLTCIGSFFDIAAFVICCCRGRSDSQENVYLSELPDEQEGATEATPLL